MTKLQPKKEISVDDSKYIVQFYAPSFGFTLWSKLVRLLGEPIVKLVGMFGDKMKGKKIEELLELDFPDLDTDAAASALASLFGNLKDEDLVPLFKDILSNTFFTKVGLANESVADHFDSEEFHGRYLHVLKLVGKTLGVQYPDFLSGLAKRRNVGKPASASKMEAMKTQ